MWPWRFSRWPPLRSQGSTSDAFASFEVEAEFLSAALSEDDTGLPRHSPCQSLFAARRAVARTSAGTDIV